MLGRGKRALRASSHLLARSSTKLGHSAKRKGHIRVARHRREDTLGDPIQVAMGERQPGKG